MGRGRLEDLRTRITDIGTDGDNLTNFTSHNQAHCESEEAGRWWSVRRSPVEPLRIHFNESKLFAHRPTHKACHNISSN